MSIVFVLLLFFAQPERMTVGECLLRHGDSHVVRDTSLVVQLAGVPTWTDYDQKALRYGKRLGSEWINTDTGQRLVWLIEYQNSQWLFVFRHANAPGAREGTAWHGSCMLRLN